MKKSHFNNETKQRFSIKKLKWGAASVLIGISFLSNGQVASASEQAATEPALENTTSVTDSEEGQANEVSVIETNTPAETNESSLSAEEEVAGQGVETPQEGALASGNTLDTETPEDSQLMRSASTAPGAVAAGEQPIATLENFAVTITMRDGTVVNPGGTYNAPSSTPSIQDIKGNYIPVYTTNNILYL